MRRPVRPPARRVLEEHGSALQLGSHPPHSQVESSHARRKLWVDRVQRLDAVGDDGEHGPARRLEGCGALKDGDVERGAGDFRGDGNVDHGTVFRVLALGGLPRVRGERQEKKIEREKERSSVERASE